MCVYVCAQRLLARVLVGSKFLQFFSHYTASVCCFPWSRLDMRCGLMTALWRLLSFAS